MNINLSAIYWSLFQDDVKVIYGSPQKLLVLEDHLFNFELGQLKEMYNNVYSTFKNRANRNEMYLAMNPPDFSLNILNLANEIYSEELYDKKSQYTAAVFRKINKLYNKNVVITKNDNVEQTFRHSIDFLCPEFTNIFRNKDYDNAVDNMSNSLEDLKIILEKICILSFIFDRECRNYFTCEINPLRAMFKEKFNHFDDAFIVDQFHKINEKYIQEVEQTFYDDIKRHHFLKLPSEKKFGKLDSKEIFYKV